MGNLYRSPDSPGRNPYNPLQTAFKKVPEITMKFPSNPYVVGTPIPGTKHFYGRESLLSFVRDTLNPPQQRVVVLYGQRRVGKTSLLYELTRYLSNQYNTVYFDLMGQANRPLSQALHEIAVQIAHTLYLTPPPLFQRPQEFRHYLHYVCLTHSTNPLLLLFDEFDDLSNIEDVRPDAAGQTLFDYLRDLLQLSLPVAFIFVVGRRLTELPENFQSILKQAPSRRVSLLSKKNTGRLITEPAANQLHYQPQAVEAIYQLTSGHPYFAQLICFELFRLAHRRQDTTITPTDVESVLDEAMETGQGGLSWFWDGLPLAERFVMAAIAEICGTTTAASLKDVRSLLASYDLRFLGQELTEAPYLLVQWEILRDSVDGYQFVVDLVRRWIVREHPLSQAKRAVENLSPRASRYFVNAREAHQTNELELAIGDYQRALVANPNHFRAQLGLAQALMETGDIPTAHQEFLRAYEMDQASAGDSLAHSYETLALADEKSGNLNKAVAKLQQAQAISPSTARQHHIVELSQTITQQQQRRQRFRRYFTLASLAILFVFLFSLSLLNSGVVATPTASAVAMEVATTTTTPSPNPSPTANLTATARRMAASEATRVAVAEAEATTAWLMQDEDGDGLPNGEELAVGTNVSVADTDGDGLTDGSEVNDVGSLPTELDTDRDGLTDGAEVLMWGTSPTLADTDGDGLTDGAELEAGRDPLMMDTRPETTPAGTGQPLILIANFIGDGTLNPEPNLEIAWSEQFTQTRIIRASAIVSDQLSIEALARPLHATVVIWGTYTDNTITTSVTFIERDSTLTLFTLPLMPASLPSQTLTTYAQATSQAFHNANGPALANALAACSDTAFGELDDQTIATQCQFLGDYLIRRGQINAADIALQRTLHLGHYEPIIISDTHGIPMAFVPSGTFQMGRDPAEMQTLCQTYHQPCPENTFTDSAPVHEVYLSPYFVDVYETTNADYTACLREGSCEHLEGLFYSASRPFYFGNPTYDDHPVIYVGWQDANAYCDWRGSRLLTEAEWEKAARWNPAQGSLTYPWGHEIPSSALLNLSEGDTVAVGSYPAGRSPIGAYDMLGNVWEWVADWYNPTYYTNAPPLDPAGPTQSTTGQKVIRGGSFEFTGALTSHTDPADRRGLLSTFLERSIGIRCATSNPYEP